MKESDKQSIGEISLFSDINQAYYKSQKSTSTFVWSAQA